MNPSRVHQRDERLDGGESRVRDPEIPLAAERIERLDRRRGAGNKIAVHQVVLESLHAIEVGEADAVRMVTASDVELLEPDDLGGHRNPSDHLSSNGPTTAVVPIFLRPEFDGIKKQQRCCPQDGRRPS
jgi:hypothetical protein